jgi:hypothetical protein
MPSGHFYELWIYIFQTLRPYDKTRQNSRKFNTFLGDRSSIITLKDEDDDFGSFSTSETDTTRNIPAQPPQDERRTKETFSCK